ncbi:hypothetical protein [Endozoicomonas numazuensis]|nr:hypothetical protein [Endozoicomonas numazuensis]
MKLHRLTVKSEYSDVVLQDDASVSPDNIFYATGIRVNSIFGISQAS